MVTAQIRDIGRSRLSLLQSVWRENELLTEVRFICVRIGDRFQSGQRAGCVCVSMEKLAKGKGMEVTQRFILHASHRSRKHYCQLVIGAFC